jgi:hypothetical protein
LHFQPQEPLEIKTPFTKKYQSIEFFKMSRDLVAELDILLADLDNEDLGKIPSSTYTPTTKPTYQQPKQTSGGLDSILSEIEDELAGPLSQPQPRLNGTQRPAVQPPVNNPTPPSNSPRTINRTNAASRPQETATSELSDLLDTMKVHNDSHQEPEPLKPLAYNPPSHRPVQAPVAPAPAASISNHNHNISEPTPRNKTNDGSFLDSIGSSRDRSHR